MTLQVAMRHEKQAARCGALATLAPSWLSTLLAWMMRLLELNPMERQMGTAHCRMLLISHRRCGQPTPGGAAAFVILPCVWTKEPVLQGCCLLFRSQCTRSFSWQVSLLLAPAQQVEESWGCHQTPAYCIELLTFLVHTADKTTCDFDDYQPSRVRVTRLKFGHRVKGRAASLVRPCSGRPCDYSMAGTASLELEQPEKPVTGVAGNALAPVHCIQHQGSSGIWRQGCFQPPWVSMRRRAGVRLAPPSEWGWVALNPDKVNIKHLYGCLLAVHD